MLRVLILGGGFAGLAAARALRRAPASITLVDRRNHHLFQPLLYQVATAMLSPAHIAAPIRRVLRTQRNARVILADVRSIDLDRRLVHAGDLALPYDVLIVATGATHSYFGRDEWANLAPGLKSVDDALDIRRRFLLAFEAAERERDPDRRRAFLTFVIVGAGPTGVELAGAMAEVARRAIPRDFRAIDTSLARVVLVEARDRVLPSFPPDLSERARTDLQRLGVEVRTDQRVSSIDERGVLIDDERIDATNVVWAAGVAASPVGAMLAVPLDHAGRVIVEPDLSIPGRPEVFVIGDLAHAADTRGNPIPGLAPAALQMGRHVAKALTTGRRLPFRYRDKGTLATIGRARAVAAIGRARYTGLPAWLLWSLVHIVYLIGFRNRFFVMASWAWEYLIFERGARLITGRRE